MTVIAFCSPATANPLEKQARHEDLMAGQELIIMGCMGKLNIPPNPSAAYSSETMAKIQECGDNEGSDIAATVAREYKNGEIKKDRIATHFLHLAVIFAKTNNSSVMNTKTEDLIRAARDKGKKNHPYRSYSSSKQSSDLNSVTR